MPPLPHADALVVEARRPMARLFAYLRPYRARAWFSIGSSACNKMLDL